MLRPLLPLLAAFLPLFGACSDRATAVAEAERALTNDGGSTGGDTANPWFFLPDSWTARRAAELSIPLFEGPLADPAGIDGEDLDLLTWWRLARVGGYQDNEVPGLAGPKQARVTLRPRFPLAGDAVLALSEPAPADSTDRIIHHAKCLLRITQDATAPASLSAQVAARTGQQLELVPLIDPLALPEGELLPVQLRVDGPARAGVEVTAWRRTAKGDTTQLPSATTDAQGIAWIDVAAGGVHLLHARAEIGSNTHVTTLTFQRGGER